ncbi:rhomboid protease GluP [Lachnospiraceae bacterium C7]|nr:rhomboid protease GluP [Lachnospiraceae bacterium C7]
MNNIRSENSFFNILKDEGFLPIDIGKGPHFQALYRVSANGDTNFFVVVHGYEMPELNINEFCEVEYKCKEIGNYGLNAKSNVQFFIADRNGNRLKEISVYLENAWGVDLQNGVLVVYENQREDFCGLRRRLDQIDYLKEKNKMDLGILKTEIPIVTYGLIAINVIIFIIYELIGNTMNTEFMWKHGASSVYDVVYNHEFWRLFTSMFLHFGIAHLTNNMIMLLLIGEKVEKALGKINYLILYISAGLGASVISCGYDFLTDNLVISAGASGAIFGVFGALLYIVFCNRGSNKTVSYTRVMVVIILCIYSGFASVGVDNAAHIGGLIVGFIVSTLLYTSNKRKYSRRRYPHKVA